MDIYTSQLSVLSQAVQPGFPPLEKEGQGGFEEVVATAQAFGTSQISPDPSLLEGVAKGPTFDSTIRRFL
jgi:hypothetical protein